MTKRQFKVLNRHQNYYLLMSSTKNKLIVVCWIISFLILATSITDIVLRVVKDQTGIGLEYFYPYCTLTYYNIKYSFTYRSFLVEFIALALSTLCSLIAFIALLISFKNVCCQSSQAIVEGQQLNNKLESTEVEVKYELLYIMSALIFFSWVVIGGMALQYFIQGDYCLVISYSVQQIVIYISMGGLGLALVFYIMTLILICQREDLASVIDMNEVKKKGPGESQDYEMGLRMEQEGRDYFANMSKRRDQTQQGMLGFDMNEDYLKYQYWKANQNQNLVEEQSEYTYYYEEIEIQNQGDLDRIIKDKSFVSLVENKIQAEPVKTEQPNAPSVEVGSSQAATSLLKDPSQKPTHAQLLKKNKNMLFIKGAQSQIVEEDAGEEGDGLEEEMEEQTSGKGLEEPDVAEQTKKLLKVMLFKNSKFFHSIFSKPQAQSECPISKYLQKDEKEEITHNDFKFKSKNKKNLFEKEQVFLEKKKRQVSSTGNNLFDESESIRKSRLERFGQEWVKERQIEEGLLKKELSDRFKKRQGLEFIRSKFYH